MRYLLISDIHSNLAALEAVLADTPPYDAVLCLGDLVGYGPNPNECVQLVKELPGLLCLSGNHDWAALGRLPMDSFNDDARVVAQWTMDQLEDNVRTWLLALPSTRQERDFAMAHGSPRDPIWEYMQFEAQGPENFRAFQTSVCFVGHTHVPRTFVETSQNGQGKAEVVRQGAGDALDLNDGRRRIVNPGSVGQPRDGDPRAAYAVFDNVAGEFAFRRAPYLVARTQEEILAAGLPEVLATRLQYGL